MRIVNAEDLTAFRAAPLFFFVSDEMPYAEFSDVIEIADHAHAIPGSIPLIQMVQPGTGEALTTEAVLDFSVHDLLTVFDSADDAGFRFEPVLTPATGAWVPVSRVCAAEAAIHSAWGDQLRGNCSCFCRSFRCHARIQRKLCEDLHCRHV
jgi:hypothetical protein